VDAEQRRADRCREGATAQRQVHGSYAMISWHAGRTVDLVVLDLVGTTIHDHSAVYSCWLDAVAAAGGRLTLQRWRSQPPSSPS